MSLDAADHQQAPCSAGVKNCEFLSIDSRDNEFDSFVPDSFLLSELVMQPDIAIDFQELVELLGIQKGQVVTRAALKKGLDRLIKKQKFEKISLAAEEIHTQCVDDISVIKLTITLTSFWTFARVQFKGSLIDRDRYRHLYALEGGEVFNKEKHVASLDKIKQLLSAQGYFKVLVTDNFIYDAATKSVIVVLTIEQGNQFIIDDVALEIVENRCNVHDKEILGDAQSLMRRALKNSYYSQSVLDVQAKKLREYFINKGFLQSTIRCKEFINEKEGKVRLTFAIELRQKNAFEFYGNTFFDRDQLLERVLLFGKSTVLIPPSLIAEELSALYKKEGFWQVSITWQEDGDRLFFFINEGKRARIVAVKVDGDKCDIPVNFGCTLEQLIHYHFKDLLSLQFFNGDVQKRAFDSLVQAYLKKGFWDFVIKSHQYVQHGEGSYELCVTIHEGKQRWLHKVVIEELYDLQQMAEVAALCHQKFPIPCNVQMIQDQRQVLIKALQKQGRIYAIPRPRFIETKDGITLIWKIVGYADIVRFGETIVLGASKLPSYVIHRELAYKPGDVWDQKKIETSVARLKSLGIFDVISITPENPAVAESEKTILLKCVEDTPYEVRVRAGLQGVNKNIFQFSLTGMSYKLGGSFFVKNPCNHGDHFRFDLDFSRYEHDIAASYHIPWLFNIPFRTEFKAYSIRHDQPIVIGSSQVLYRSAQDGFLMGLNRKYSTVDAGITIGTEWLAIKPNKNALCCKNSDGEIISPAQSLACAIDLKQSLIDKRFPYFYVEPTIFINHLDNKMQPTKGFSSLFSLKGMLAPTLSHASFIKLLIEQSVFIPLWGPLVLAIRGRAGIIGLADLSSVMPIERFYLGGAYTVRAYEPDFVPPLNEFLDAQCNKRLVPVGGKAMLNMNTELRFPIYRSVSGALFFDIGSLSKKGWHAIAGKDWVGAVGFGLRYNTVVGSLRFDIGWKLRPSHGAHGFVDRSFAWYLVLGNAF